VRSLTAVPGEVETERKGRFHMVSHRKSKKYITSAHVDSFRGSTDIRNVGPFINCRANSPICRLAVKLN
jgi:hypothetical protein